MSQSRDDGTNCRARGTNPRAKGTNPRGSGFTAATKHITGKRSASKGQYSKKILDYIHAGKQKRGKKSPVNFFD